MRLSQGELRYRQKQALLSEDEGHSVAMQQPCHEHEGRQDGRTGAQTSDTLRDLERKFP